jgi:hypothetical protein
LEVSATYLKAVDFFGRDRSNNVRVPRRDGPKFCGQLVGYDFDFKTRIGVLLAKMMPSHCSDRQSIRSSCKAIKGVYQ